MACRVVAGDFSVCSLEDDDECEEERQIVLQEKRQAPEAPTAMVQLKPR